jgi:hypothetical protein
MRFDPACISTSYIKVSTGGYLNLNLAYDARSDEELSHDRCSYGNIKMGAHVLVCWAIFGPPPNSIQDPVVMHYCDQSCLQPHHIVWGEKAENSSDGSTQANYSRWGYDQIKNKHAERRIIERMATYGR